MFVEFVDRRPDLVVLLFVERITVGNSGLVEDTGPCQFVYIWRGGPSSNPLIAQYVNPWATSPRQQVGQWQETGVSFSSEVGNSRTGSCVPGHGKKPPGNPSTPGGSGSGS